MKSVLIIIDKAPYGYEDGFAWGHASPVMLCVSKWAWIDV
jgi:sulfur relay (sulfurtransferase) DsrF/TusC family protein